MNYYATDLLTLSSGAFYDAYKTSPQVAIVKLLSFNDRGDELPVVDDATALRLLLKVMDDSKGHLKHIPLASLFHDRLMHDSIFNHVTPDLLMKHLVDDIRATMTYYKGNPKIERDTQHRMMEYALQAASALLNSVSLCRRVDLNASLTDENLQNHPLSILMDHVEKKGRHLHMLQHGLLVAKTLPVSIRKRALRLIATAYTKKLKDAVRDAHKNGLALSYIQREKDTIAIGIKYRNESKEINNYSAYCNLITGDVNRLQLFWDYTPEEREFLDVEESATKEIDRCVAEGLFQRLLHDASDSCDMRIVFEKAVPFPEGKHDSEREMEQAMAAFEMDFDLSCESLH